jgi:hypothetical protein
MDSGKFAIRCRGKSDDHRSLSPVCCSGSPLLSIFFPNATSQQLFDLVFHVFLDLGLPSKVETQYQDLSVTDLIHAHSDILEAISGTPSLPLEYCDPLPPTGPIRFAANFPSLVFSCSSINDDPAIHEQIDQIIALIPKDFLSIFADSPEPSLSTDVASVPRVPQRLHPLDTTHKNFRKNLNTFLHKLLGTFGITQDFRLDNPFPVDKFFLEVMSDWEVMGANDR